MMYRNWSLLSSTVAIWGAASVGGLAGFWISGGKEKFQGGYLCAAKVIERLRKLDKAMATSANGA